MTRDSNPPTADPSDPSRLRKHSLIIAGHRTSVSLEDAFWRALGDIAAARGLSIAALITEIDRARTGNLSSAIRVFVLAILADGGKSTSSGS